MQLTSICLDCHAIYNSANSSLQFSQEEVFYNLCHHVNRTVMFLKKISVRLNYPDDFLRVECSYCLVASLTVMKILPLTREGGHVELPDISLTD